MKIEKYWVYYLLMIGALLIRFLPFSSGIADIDEAMNDIAVGAFASLVVALSIAIHDDKKTAEEDEIILSRIILPYYQALIDYMEFFCNICSLSKDSLKSDRKSFEEWYKLFKIMAENDELFCFETSDIKERIDRISREGDRILSSEVILLKMHILEKEDIDFMKEISSKFVLIDIMYKADTKNFVHNLTAINNSLVELLAKSESYKVLIEDKYGFDYRILSARIESLKKFSKGK